MSKNGTNGKNELNKLFIAYEAAERAADEAEAALAKANAAKSAAVKAIAEKAEELGFGNGPFNRGGRVLTISTRQPTETKVVDGKETKVNVGEPTYFFRGPRAAAVDVSG